MQKHLDQFHQQVNRSEIQRVIQWSQTVGGEPGVHVRHGLKSLRGFVLLASFGKVIRNGQNTDSNVYGRFEMREDLYDLSDVIEQGDAVLIARLDVPAEDAALVKLKYKKVHKRTAEVWVRCRIPI